MKLGFSAVLAFATAALCIFGNVACTVTASAPPTTNDVGTSSGGGGFGDENSMKLLEWSSSLTAASIRRANPKVFSGLPKDWTQERLARLIENVKQSPRTEVSRYSRELMFDYGVDSSGEPFITATALFFRAHSAIPVNSLFAQDLEPYLREIRTRLLHEAAHVMGIGLTEKSDIKARAFAAYVTGKLLGENNIICEIPDVPQTYPGRIENEVSPVNSKALYTWAINRPTGFSLQAFRSESLVTERPWLRALRAGEPASMHSFAMMQFVSETATSYPEYSREFADPYFASKLPNRLTRQYYKDFEIKPGPDARFAVVGGMASTVVRQGVITDYCSVEERVEVPLSSAGSYKGRITFTESCSKADPSDAIVSTPTRVEFEIDCKESFNQLLNFDEFVGEQEFKSPWLVEWMKYKDEFQ